MRKMVDRVTGVDIFVADDRVEEYLKAGHKFPDTPPKTTEKPRRKKTSKKEG